MTVSMIGAFEGPAGYSKSWLAGFPCRMSCISAEREQMSKCFRRVGPRLTDVYIYIHMCVCVEDDHQFGVLLGALNSSLFCIIAACQRLPSANT